jgi:hypothetical protein
VGSEGFPEPTPFLILSYSTSVDASGRAGLGVSCLCLSSHRLAHISRCARRTSSEAISCFIRSSLSPSAYSDQVRRIPRTAHILCSCRLRLRFSRLSAHFHTIKHLTYENSTGNTQSLTLLKSNVHWRTSTRLARSSSLQIVEERHLRPRVYCVIFLTNCRRLPLATKPVIAHKRPFRSLPYTARVAHLQVPGVSNKHQRIRAGKTSSTLFLQKG